MKYAIVCTNIDDGQIIGQHAYYTESLEEAKEYLKKSYDKAKKVLLDANNENDTINIIDDKLEDDNMYLCYESGNLPVAFESYITILKMYDIPNE